MSELKAKPPDVWLALRQFCVYELNRLPESARKTLAEFFDEQAARCREPGGES